MVEGCGHVVKGCGGGQRSCAAARCPRSRPVRRRPIGHLFMACRVQSAQPPVGREAFAAAVAHLGRHDGRFAQAAQDHVFRPLCAPSVDSTLQRSPLCLAGVRIRNHRCQPPQQGLGRHGGFGFSPAVDNRPRVGKRAHPGPPPMLGRGLFAMRWTRLTIVLRGHRLLGKTSTSGDFAGAASRMSWLTRSPKVCWASRISWNNCTGSRPLNWALSFSFIAGPVLLCARSRSQGVASVQ